MEFVHISLTKGGCFSSVEW